MRVCLVMMARRPTNGVSPSESGGAAGPTGIVAHQNTMPPIPRPDADHPAFFNCLLARTRATQ